jgi:hydrogenase maturation protein HypF
VIGVSLDGTGLGSDGHIWGGEFMVADLLGFRRQHHFEYLPLPGGDAAVREPWRLALALLHGVYGEGLFDLGLPLLQGREEDSYMLVQAIRQKINCPLSSGAGRLFDAVAALSGLCGRAWFHAEAPMRLESVIDPDVSDAYTFEVGSPVISFRSMVQEIVEDLRQEVAPAVISARFHNTVISLVRTVTVRLAAETDIRKVILSGGTFQNRYLLGNLEEILPREGLEVYSNLRVPVNDGGIALGQLAIAAKMRECHVSEYTC